MSVLKIRRKTKTVWRVHWREAGHDRTRHFNRKQDAVLYDAEVKRRKQLGDLHTLTASRRTLAEFAEEWFELYAIPNLAQATQRSYACLWDAHALPRLGGYQLRELTPKPSSASATNSNRQVSDLPPSAARLSSCRASSNARSNGGASPPTRRSQSRNLRRHGSGRYGRSPQPPSKQCAAT